MQTQLLKLLCDKNALSYIVFDTNFLILESSKAELIIGQDIRHYLWELVGMEEEILKLNKSNKKLEIPMVLKKNIHYDIDISSFQDKKNTSLFIAYMQEKSLQTANYAHMIQEINKKMLIYEMSEEKNEHLYYQQINKRLLVFHVNLDGLIIKLNDVCSHFFNLEKEKIIGNHFSHFFHPQKQSQLQESHIFSARNSFGEVVFFHVDIIPLTNRKNQIVHNIFIAQDVSYLKQIEKELEYVSEHDTLTGLPNYHYFLKQLDKLRVQSNKVVFALIDIDHFSHINEEYGAHASDMLLKHLSTILEQLSNPCEEVIRLQGDTFAIIFEADTSKKYIQTLIETLESEISKHPLLYTQEDTINFTCSYTIHVSTQEQQLQSKDIFVNAEKKLKRIKIDKYLSR